MVLAAVEEDAQRQRLGLLEVLVVMGRYLAVVEAAAERLEQLVQQQTVALAELVATA